MAKKSKAKPGLPPILRLGFSLLFLLVAAAAVNFIAQLIRKPTEILRFVSGDNSLTAAQLWARHGDAFKRHATKDLTPHFLAGMAFLESSGDGLAAPPWRFSVSRGLLRVYAPASSAVGLMQFTDETFERYSDYCVHGGKVVRDGPWWDPRTCWFTALNTRLSPSDSIEVAAAYLQNYVDLILGRRGTPVQRRRLAAVIHLCGAGKARALIGGGFNPEAVGLCGDQPAGAYVRRIEALERRFVFLDSD